jgi:hypothetical protein
MAALAFDLALRYNEDPKETATTVAMNALALSLSLKIAFRCFCRHELCPILTERRSLPRSSPDFVENPLRISVIGNLEEFMTI